MPRFIMTQTDRQTEVKLAVQDRANELQKNKHYIVYNGFSTNPAALI